MPKFAEFAERVLELVADELEVAKEQILSKSRKAETVDARHMAVKLLHANNIYIRRKSPGSSALRRGTYNM